MNKKIVLLLLILIISFKTIIATGETDLWDFENNLVSSGSASNNLTESPTLVFNSTVSACNDYSLGIEESGNAYINSGNIRTDNADRCISYWYWENKDYGGAIYSYSMMIGNKNGGDAILIYHMDDNGEGGTDSDWRVDGWGASWRTYLTFNRAVKQWQHVAFSYENTTRTWCAYVNGTSKDCGQWSSDMDLEANSPIHIGSDVDGLVPYTGKLDYVTIADGMNCTDYYGITGGVLDNWDSCGAPVVSNPTMTINTNLQNNTKNWNQETINITYNATFTDIAQGTDNATCLFYANDVLNITDTNKNLSILQDFYYTFPVNSSQWFNFSINCTATDSSSNDTTIKYYYQVDFVQPFINSNYINNTVYNTSQILSFYFNVSDNNLDYIGLSYINQSNITLLNYTWENFNDTFFSNLSYIVLNNSWVGNNTIFLIAGDSHNPTNKIHEKYKDFESLGYYNKITFRNGYIEILDTNIKEYKLIEEENKYKEEIKFNDNNGQMHIRSNVPIRYYPDSDHLGHFVFRLLSKYKDFDNDYGFVISYVEKVSDYEYIIDYHTDEKNIKTKTLGDLNINQISYNFQVYIPPAPPTDLEIALDLLNNNLGGINDNLEKAQEGLNMLWFWIVFIIFSIIPMLFRDKLTTDSYTGLASISLIVMIALLFALLYLDFGLTGFFKSFIAIMIIYVAYRHSLDAGLKFNRR